MSKKCLYTSLISVTILFLLLSFGALLLFMKIDYFIDEQVKKVSTIAIDSRPENPIMFFLPLQNSKLHS